MPGGDAGAQGCMVKWELWYLSVCYALVQWSITAVVYFNPVSPSSFSLFAHGHSWVLYLGAMNIHGCHWQHLRHIR